MLIHDPQLLLLDEPASGLDPRARIEMMAILQELQRLGKTIIISSHILSEVEAHALPQSTAATADDQSDDQNWGITVERRLRPRC